MVRELGIDDLKDILNSLEIAKDKNEEEEKLSLFSKNNLTNRNTVGLTSNLVDAEHRGKGYFKELTQHRVNHVLANGYENFIIFKNLDLKSDIKYLVDNGWKKGIVVERQKESKKAKHLLLFLSKKN
jgi:predicted GNAT family acetyltransferase